MHQRTSDILAFVTLMAFTLLFALYVVDFSKPPFEDAAMLMRYAEHLAQGEGIVWNIGEPPVDGATDFLFMVLVALLHSIGFSLEGAVRFITIGSHFITVALIYFGVRKLQQSGVLPAWLSAAYFAVCPGLVLASAYFGTPFFALAVACAWLLGQRIIFSGKVTNGGCLSFSLVCLIVGLIRPEGVLMSVFMLIAIGVMLPFKDACRLAMIFTAVFIVLGGIYFAWRWNYFGYPLPNPYYKKGEGDLHINSLLRSIKNSWRLIHLIVIVLIVAMFFKSARRLAIAFSIPIVGSVVMWVLISNEMNFEGRFQYPIVAIAILSWYPLVRTLRNNFRWPVFSSLTPIGQTVRVMSIMFIALAVAAAFESRIDDHSYSKKAKRSVLDARYVLGIMLRDYADKSYTMAVSEAGLLPFYSKWRAIDTWGLNDQWIAHNGGLITKEYLHKQKPDIMMWHVHPPHFYPPKPGLSEAPGWYHRFDYHVATLQAYAEQHGYTLATISKFGREAHMHRYYVRPENPDHDEIVQRIRSAYDSTWGRSEICDNKPCESQNFEPHPNARPR